MALRTLTAACSAGTVSRGPVSGFHPSAGFSRGEGATATQSHSCASSQAQPPLLPTWPSDVAPRTVNFGDLGVPRLIACPACLPGPQGSVFDAHQVPGDTHVADS